VIRRARMQEPAVITALREAGRHLGHGASVLANLLDPEVVILGGYYVPLAPWIIPAAQDELTARTVMPGAAGARLVASALGHDAPATGGAAQVLDLVDAGQLPISID
jgi:predicted NBD/HSP70 family sugar kinase